MSRQLQSGSPSKPKYDRTHPPSLTALKLSRTGSLSAPVTSLLSFFRAPNATKATGSSS